MNKVILMGNIATDLNWQQENYCKFNLAVKRKYSRNNEADFVNCVAFGKTGDLIGTYFTKGSKILVEGEIRTGSYENKEGKKVFSTSVNISSAEFCEKSKNEEPNPGKSPDGFYAQAEDEGLPFD